MVEDARVESNCSSYNVLGMNRYSTRAVCSRSNCFCWNTPDMTRYAPAKNNSKMALNILFLFLRYCARGGCRQQIIIAFPAHMGMETRKRVLLFGTHPNQYNGYSKVVYHLMKRLESWRGNDSGDLDLYIFGFQNFHTSATHDRVLQYTKIYDAYFHEDKKLQGFGFAQIQQVYDSIRPHVCIVYNDMVVVVNVLQKILEAQKNTEWKSKILIYTDQVYDCQKLSYIQVLNSHVDGVVCFTDSWKQCLLNQGIRDTLPVYVLPHGFDRSKVFPIPKHIARKYLGLSDEDFLILNSNRNQPRKRWDICIMAFAEIVRRHLGEPIKLVVGTIATGDSSQCAWDLVELLRFEFRKLGVPEEQGLKHVVFTDKPQSLTDEDINALYNATDIGINTCDGEGFGLCNFEQAAVGKPQVVARVGGFRDLFDSSFSITVVPKAKIYVDNSRDHVGGLAELCDPLDFADAIDTYYNDRDLCRDHGAKARQHMIENYDWDDVSRTYEKIIDLTLPASVPDDDDVEQSLLEKIAEASKPPATVSVQELVQKKLDDARLKQSEKSSKKKKKRMVVRNDDQKDDGSDTEEKIKTLSDELKILIAKAEAKRAKKPHEQKKNKKKNKNNNKKEEQK